MEKNGKVVFVFDILIHLFFASFIINLFITLYSIYSFFEMNFCHALQGSKLKFKKFP